MSSSDPNEKFLTSVVKHYENCLATYGDNHLGVDWPKLEDVKKRYQVMVDIINFNKDKREKISFLDLGCGASHLAEFVVKENLEYIVYSGLDISEKFVELSKAKFPQFQYYNLDILKDADSLPVFDYIVMNGVFTEKRELSFDEMWEYVQNMLIKVFSKTSSGMAFNVMSKAVEWERWDLFHLPLDTLQSFLVQNLTRNFIIRNDYRLYEYSVYLYK